MELDVVSLELLSEMIHCPELLFREEHGPVSSELSIGPPSVDGPTNGSEEFAKVASIGDDLKGREVEGRREEAGRLDDGLERGARKFEGLLIDDFGRGVGWDLDGKGDLKKRKGIRLEGERRGGRKGRRDGAHISSRVEQLKYVEKEKQSENFFTMQGRRKDRLTWNAKHWLLCIDPRVAPNRLKVADAGEGLEGRDGKNKGLERLSVKSKALVDWKGGVGWLWGRHLRDLVGKGSRG